MNVSSQPSVICLTIKVSMPDSEAFFLKVASDYEVKQHMKGFSMRMFDNNSVMTLAI